MEEVEMKILEEFNKNSILKKSEFSLGYGSALDFCLRLFSSMSKSPEESKSVCGDIPESRDLKPRNS